MKLYEKNNQMDYELIDSECKSKFKIQVEMTVTPYDVENIIITAIEGGIGYWACLLNDEIEFDNQPDDIPVSQYATELLLLGETIKFADTEEFSEIWELTLEKLLLGIKLSMEDEPFDLNDLDAEQSDCIVQYALFGELIYG
jgi:hypothetical protein